MLRTRLTRLYTTATNAAKQPLSWSDFFVLRKSKARWESAGGVVGLGLGLAGGAGYFLGVAEFDPLAVPILGLPDPSMAYFLGIIVCGFGGYVGGTLGALPLWRAVRSNRLVSAIEEKEREFYKRIRTHRPKELRINMVPGAREKMPDYYGEKVHSVSAYRKWIREQRLFVARLKSGRLEAGIDG